jgi:SulP family sulfate permease
LNQNFNTFSRVAAQQWHDDDHYYSDDDDHDLIFKHTPIPSPPQDNSGKSALSTILSNSNPESNGCRSSIAADGYTQPQQQLQRPVDPFLPEINETFPLFKAVPQRSDTTHYNSISQPIEIHRDPLASSATKRWTKTLKNFVETKLTKKNVIEEGIIRPIHYLPSVVLGLLLNILDGLSYGMILFPLAEPVFSHLGPVGLSMFYVSCIVSQLTYSLGGSGFHSGVGSEMIEVVPFFHSMARTLLLEIGDDNPRSVIATTIVAFATSSIVTGLVFFTLGYAKLGSLVGFFPRHILVGCIGGVGWFLIVTGIEVSSRMQGNLEYNWETLKYLFWQVDDYNVLILVKWVVPIVLAALLILIQKKVTQNPLLVPGYFISVFIAFHLLVVLIPNLSYQLLRDAGWLFQGPTTSEPWWYFYTLYDFKEVDYWSLVKTVPAMFALTFFGILHVPINVPALATSIGEDNINIDHELLAHGISNVLSGLMGSIQNYLVYTNSVLFIRCGADSRLSGVMLAFATFGIMISGPDVIGFIPVMVVGALIFILGFELVEEALVDTWGRVSRFEYATIVVIVVTMGVVDFVVGIIVGILLACVSLVIQTAQRSAIKATFTGEVARSTVRRNAVQQRFLSDVGDQIFVMRLGGNIFFGTIVRVEQAIRDLLDEDKYFKERPIRYLILDMGAVTSIDFSAAEAFCRIKRLLDTKSVFLLITGLNGDANADSKEIIKSLRSVGLFNNEEYGAANREEESATTHYEDESWSFVRLFPNLNSALEWSENQFLKTYFKTCQLAVVTATGGSSGESSRTVSGADAVTKLEGLTIADLGLPDSGHGLELATTPRLSVLHKSAARRAREESQQRLLEVVESDASSCDSTGLLPEPVPLFLQTFQDIATPAHARNIRFWTHVGSFFRRQVVPRGTVLYHSGGAATGFYVVESGMLRAEYRLAQGELYESISAGTTCGELPFFSETLRTATVAAAVGSVVWALDREDWERLRAWQPEEDDAAALPSGREMAQEIYELALRLTVERFTSVMGYVMISANTTTHSSQPAKK